VIEIFLINQLMDEVAFKTAARLEMRKEQLTADGTPAAELRI
jgi:hypothetical protein